MTSNLKNKQKNNNNNNKKPLLGNAVTYLMFHVVLHVYVTTSKNFETEGAEQVFCVFMDTSEMRLHIREERGPVIADLWNQ